MAEPNRRLADLIDDWEPKLRDAFLQAVSRITDSVVVSRIADKLERGDIEGALAAVNIDPLAFRALDAQISLAYEDGGDFVVPRIPALREPSGDVLKVLFDVRNPRAENWLRERSSSLITEIVEDQRVAVRQHLMAGMEAGLNPRTVALDLVGRKNPATGRREGGVVGLTSSQEGWSRRFAERLASGDPEALKAALRMELRDKRFDGTVLKAIREGKPIPADKRVAMVAAYRDKALKLRGDTIGRTEAMRALHAAQEEAFQQAIDAGQVVEARVYKFWRSAGDFRVRHTHRSMNGQKVAFRAEFVSPSGARLRYPGDERAPASETVMCRCWMECKISYLSALKAA